MGDILNNVLNLVVFFNAITMNEDKKHANSLFIVVKTICEFYSKSLAVMQ